MKEETRKALDARFELILPLIKKGYTRMNACKKLGFSRGIIERLTDEQKRKLDEAEILNRGHNFLNKGRKK